MVTAQRARMADAQHDYERIHRRSVRSLAKAERALDETAERELTSIERTLQVCNPPPPIEAADRPLPTARRRLERFLRAAAASLGFWSGTVLLVIDRAYVAVLFGGTGRDVTDLHFCLGEGPAIDSWESTTMVEVADLAKATTRWPAFAPAALEIGIRSVLCVPLCTDQADLVLAFWGPQPIPPRPRSWSASRTRVRSTPERLDQLRRVKSIANTLLAERPEMITFESLLLNIEDTVDERAVVYQAAGTLAARLSIDPREALDLLRIQAWADHRPLEDLSEQLLCDS